MAMSIFFSFLPLLTFLHQPVTQGTILTLPSLLSPTPSATCAVFSELCSSNHPLSRITAVAPRPSLPTHLSAGRNSSVRFGSVPQRHSPPCLKAWGPSCCTACKPTCYRTWRQSLPSPPCPSHSASLTPPASQVPKSGSPLWYLQSFLFFISDPTSLLRWALLCFPIYVSPL